MAIWKTIACSAFALNGNNEFTGQAKMISHHHKTVFTHIPKCAGQSVERAFLSDIGLTWDARAPLHLHFNDQVRAGPPRLAHLTSKQYVELKYVTPTHWREYYKFAIVRNPIDRAVSLYNHIFHNRHSIFISGTSIKSAMKGGKTFDFTSFLETILMPTFSDAKARVEGTRDYYDGLYWFVRPQCDFIYDGDMLLVDDYFDISNLNVAWQTVQQKSKLSIPLPKENASRKYLSRSDLTVAQIRKIEDLYFDDFSRLGFK